MDFFGLPITIPPLRYIGDIVPDVTIEEVHSDELTITDHPVEQNAMISDHAYKRPVELIMRCGWSNSSWSADGDEEFVRAIYQQLLDLQNQREVFPVSTGKRKYQNMLIQSLHTTTDEKTETTLLITVRLRQVIIVQTTTTTLPPTDVQKIPSSTAEVVNQGSKSLLPASPSPGGALPIPGVDPSNPQPSASSVGEIPLINNPQSLGISLGGVDHTLTAKYHDSMGWVMDIADSDGAPIAQGLPLVTGSDLLAQLKYLGIGNGGGIHIQSDFNPDAVPTFSNLGINSQAYFTSAEQEALVTT